MFPFFLITLLYLWVTQYCTHCYIHWDPHLPQRITVRYANVDNPCVCGVVDVAEEIELKVAVMTIDK